MYEDERVWKSCDEVYRSTWISEGYQRYELKILLKLFGWIGL